MPERCAWATTHPLLERYHDEEWGVPAHDRNRLFEFVILEGVQAGLSWLTVLKRRDAYREAMAGFDPEVVAGWSDADVADLLTYPGIIHNRAKIASHRLNARSFLGVEEEFGGFDRYLDRWIEGVVVHRFRTAAEVPAQDSLAASLSRDLHRRGFRFFGPTICYSYLQAVGRVMDHVTDCFRYADLATPH